MLGVVNLRWSVPLAAVFAAGVGGTALGHDTRTGGASIPERPAVGTLRCADGAAFECGQGERLVVRGEGLVATRTVTFLGQAGRGDDRDARPHRKAPHRLEVTVPADAAPGPVRIVARISSETQRSPRSRPLDVRPAEPQAATPAPAGDAVFPIRGRHTYGSSSANRFGGGRGHQGQDVFAACGTPLVAAQGGKVERAGLAGAMGNHVVITRPDGASNVYMHLAGTPKVKAGELVSEGQALGAVGDTGRASGCHLHFEIWNAPGWTRGKPVDPLPELERWDAMG